jgi:hypothetical protein
MKQGNMYHNKRYLSNLTNEQSSTLSNFKNKLLEYDPLINFNLYDDSYLLRFLRARKFDLEKTFEMFIKFLKWRTEFGTEEIDVFFFKIRNMITLN